MFTPIGFFAPQQTGFDPTLGGTLNVLYHWDFTDSSTMNLTGTTVNSISDKISSSVLTTYLGTPQLKSGYVRFGDVNTNGMRSGANNIPAGMFNNNTFTIICFSKLNGTIGNNTNVFVWALQSNQTNGWRGATFGGWRNTIPGTWSPSICNNYGSGQNVLMRWFGTSNQSRHTSMTTTMAQKLCLIGFGYDSVNARLMHDNGTENSYACTRTLAKSTDSGNGLHINVDISEGAYSLDYYHMIVYTDLFTSQNQSDLWNAFNATQQ